MAGLPKKQIDAMLREAEAAIEQLRPAFEVEMVRGVRALAATWSKCTANPTPDERGELFRLSHDLKGQGGSFGFDLLTDVAASLCRLLHRLDTSEPTVLQRSAIDLHVRAMEAIAQKKVRGDGGTLGRQLVKEIAALSEKAT